MVSLELEGDSVRLRLVSGGDQAYLQSLQAVLSEWSSDAD
ncbi:hypothetical protein SynBOUM118_00475 [Synechococcus sp. BOUM118]|nr:hypothetical protein SynBOUM118_00475 [Synechococcus sp. BOUM118]